MAVALDTTGTVTKGVGADSISWSHTCSGSNRLLLVIVSYNSANGESVANITFGSQNLTFYAVSSRSGNVELWYLIAPNASSQTITVTFTTNFGGGDVTSVADSISFTGVHQTTPLGTAQTANNSNTAVTVNVTGASSSNIVVDGVHVFGGTTTPSMTVGAGQTSRWNAGQANSPVSEVGTCSTEPSTNGTVTMSWTIGATKNWATVAVEVLQAPTTALKDIIRCTGVIPWAR